MTGVLLYIFGILIVVIGIAVSIALHEIGHLIPAKLFGVKVTQYMVGFGKTLWSKRKGETEYGIKAIPLGGYVAMIGMYPPKKPGEAPRESTTGFLNSVVEERPDVIRRHPSDVTTELDRIGDTDPDETVVTRRGIAGMVDEARQASAETIAEGEEGRTFYGLPVWKKIIIMLGGPFMNLVLAFVFFGIVLMGFGVPQYSTTVSTVSECLIPASSDASTCGAEDPQAPGAAAGLRPGDQVLAIDGTPVADWQQLRDTVSASPGIPLQLTIERGGAEQVLTITPAESQRWATDDAGQVIEDEHGDPVVETVGMIGISPGTEVVQQPLSEVPAYVGENVRLVAGVILNLPQRMVAVWNAAFGAEERELDGPMSVVGVGRIAGEVVSMEEQPVAARAQMVVGLLGSLNVALFVFNLVPLMPLDGGHIAGALYEGLKRGWAKIRRKPDPGPIDTAKMVPVTFFVVVLLGAMSLLLIYADIVKPISLG